MANAASNWLETGLDYVGKAMGVVSPILGWLSSSNTNAKNLQMMREQNQFNAEQAQMQRDWSANEAGKQRGFEADQALLAREYATNERKAQQDWQESMIEQLNEYNSPVNQVVRMSEAGLSPLSLTGVESSASPTGIPSGSLGAVPSSGIPSGASASSSGINPAIDPFLSASQARYLDAQSRNLEAKTNTENATRDSVVELNRKQYQLWDSEIPVNEANARFLTSSAKKQDAEIDVINETVKKLMVETRLIDNQGKLVQKDIDSYSLRLQSDLNKAAAEAGLYIANAKTVASQIALNCALAQQASANASLASAQTDALSLSNFLDGVKLKFMKNHQEFTYSIAQDSVIADWLGGANARAGVKRQALQNKADEKMLKMMNDDIIAFLRALGSCLNLSVGAHVK